MAFTFALATVDDLAAAKAIARSAAASEYSHWDEEYPACMLGEDIENKRLYLLREEGRPIAMIAMLSELEGPTSSFPWPEPSPAPCMLARLGILKEAQGRGLATTVMELAAETARKQGYRTARLLATEDNPLTNHIYKKLGYVARGKAVVFDLEEFVGYELAL